MGCHVGLDKKHYLHDIDTFLTVTLSTLPMPELAKEDATIWQME